MSCENIFGKAATGEFDCGEVSELLPEYVGGGLSRELRGKVALHLSCCEECRRETAFLLRLKRPVALPGSVRKSAFSKVRADAKAERQTQISDTLELLSDTFRTTRAALRLAKEII